MPTLTNKHYISLASIMLLAHLVPAFLHRDGIEIATEDKEFIDGYLQLGKWFVYTCAVGIGIWILSSTLNLPHSIFLVSQTLLCVVIISIVIAMIAIWKNISLVSHGSIDRDAMRALLRSHTV
jgi:hypothetical protein